MTQRDTEQQIVFAAIEKIRNRLEEFTPGWRQNVGVGVCLNGDSLPTFATVVFWSELQDDETGITFARINNHTRLHEIARFKIERR